MKMTISGLEHKLREVEVWVAEANDTIVGWVAIKSDYLEGLYTDPSFARRGIGGALLHIAEAAMREQGVKIARADASWNAEDFYIRRGYQPTGPRPPDGPRPLVKQL